MTEAKRQQDHHIPKVEEGESDRKHDLSLDCWCLPTVVEVWADTYVVKEYVTHYKPSED